jgi:hypothetical protein
MVFMGAATIRGNEPLLDAADADIAELRAVGSGKIGDTEGELNIFVQEHGRGPNPRRCHISNGAFEAVTGRGANPQGGRAVEEFIAWSMAEVGPIPEGALHHTLLVLWGHSYDFAFGRELSRDEQIDALDFAELKDLLTRLQERLGDPGARLDVLGFDSCDAATVEIACQLEPFANYLIASQVGIPIPGWPYDRILIGLRKPYGRVMGPSEFGSWAVRRFAESYDATSPSSLSFLNLQRAPDLRAHTAVLAATLARVMGDPIRQLLADLFYRSQTDEDRPYIDVADLCLTLVRDSGDPLIVEAARSLGDFLLGANPPLANMSPDASRRPFVVERGRNAAITARLNGVSLYAPHLVPSRDFEGPRALYHNFDFVQQTRWSDFVHTLARLA